MLVVSSRSGRMEWTDHQATAAPSATAAVHSTSMKVWKPSATLRAFAATVLFFCSSKSMNWLMRASHSTKAGRACSIRTARARAGSAACCRRMTSLMSGRVRVSVALMLARISTSFCVTPMRAAIMASSRSADFA